MEDNLNNDVKNPEDVQDSELNLDGFRDELIFENKLEDENLENNDLYEKQKKQNEQELLEQINREIEAKQKEIENIQLRLYYFETGEAYAQNEEDYNSGVIDEKEYLANKEALDLEFDQVREDMTNARASLQNLLQRREKITGIKERNEVEEDVVNHRLLENLDEEEPLTREDKGTGEDNKNDKEVEKNNTQGTPAQQSNFAPPQENNMPNVQEQRMDVYKKPNRFFGFFKNIINKIRNFVGIRENEQIENIAVNELNREGIQLESSEFRESTLGEELSQYICSNEEIIQNMNRRESQEVNEVQVTRRIDDNMI